MRRATVLLAVLLLAGGLAGRAHATRVVRAPDVEVLYDEPGLASYAQTVAADAQAELEQVARLFGRKPFPIRIRLQSGDDVFNAFALPLPRPHVTFRPLFPIGGTVGFHGADLTELVLRHELTHLVQLTDTRVPPGAHRLPRIGLVGQGTAVLPPAWLLEGIAVWVESHGGLGGRLHDARTRALLWTLAASGKMPSLSDVSLISYHRWPGGRARYLLGGSFLDYLVRRHGFDALVRTLHAFQAGAYTLPFAAAWRATVGTDLDREWSAWTRELAAEARSRPGLAVPAALEAPSSDVGPLALAPDGRTLAWGVEQGVRLAALREGALQGARTLRLQLAAEGLTWTGPRTLVMAAVARDPGAYPSDLFSVDVRTGRVTRLTHGAHAHLPRSDGHGCVLYVRDVVPEGASLRRWCPDRPVRVVWTAPAGVHIVGLAVSPAGRVALSLYRPGGVDLALLGPRGPRYLTHDAASELGPAWVGSDTLVYASDATGLFQLYRMQVPGARPSGGGAPAAAGRSQASPLTSALGGAQEATPAGGGIVYRTLHGSGYALAWLPAASRAAAQAPAARAPGGGAPAPGAPGGRAPAAGAPAAQAPSAGLPPAAPSPYAQPRPRVAPGPFPDRPYHPWPSLLPYGWLPSGGRLSLSPPAAGLQVTAFGLDDSARYALDLTAGYDTGLAGPLDGAYAWVRYAWNMPDPARAPGPPPPLGLAVTVGSWPHGAYLGPVDETAFGVSAQALLHAPVGAFAGALDVSASWLDAPALPGWRPEASVDGVLDDLHTDVFGAVSSGTAFGVHGRWSYGAAGPSAGAWLSARWYPRLGGTPVTWRLALSAGYRPQPPVPVVLPELAAVASIGARLPVPVRWRYGDGLYALERLDVEPSARLWAGAGPGSAGAWAPSLGAGADVALWADTVLDYDAVVRFGVRGGYADGWWLGLGLGLPF